MGTRSGLLVVDKPGGITSHDVVSRTRKLCGTRKVGHAGTLDPMATGVLVLGVNSSTRLLTYVVGLEKEYEATIRLGEATTTDDAEGETSFRASSTAIHDLTDIDLHRVVAQFRGAIEQVPSSVSAIKVDGKRSYARVRAGEAVELAARPVTVTAFDVLDIEVVSEVTAAGPADYWDVRVRVECSTGTYIRALARDIGAELGVGGHLTALRRTRIGPFRVADAARLETMTPGKSMIDPADAARMLFRTVDCDETQTTDLRHGKRIALAESDCDGSGEGPVAALAPDGSLIGLVEVGGGEARVLVNFPPDPETAERKLS